MDENKKKKKYRDNPLVYTLILAGALGAALLILLGTRFTEYMKLYQNGFALSDGNITVSLAKQPDDTDIQKTIEMIPFDIAENIYKQGSRYFIGEKKKEPLQAAYPLFIENGMRLQLVDTDSVLITDNYESASVYLGMYIQNQAAYNPDGERADAADYLFISLSNGNYVNLSDIFYRYKGEELHIPQSSIVRFAKDYISFYEIEDGVCYYNSIPYVSYDDVFVVGNEDLTYEELLLKLNIIHETPEFEDAPKEEDNEEIVPELEPELTEDTEEEEYTTPIEEELEEEASPRPQKQEKDTTPSSKPEKEPREPQPAPSSNSGSNNSSSPQNKGVRPDSMRPDKYSDPQEPIKDYIKPEVELNSIEAGVYRIMASLDVYDPAERLHKGKKVQVEVYELDSKGNKTLAGRGYKGAPGGTVTVGGGMIKPETNYLVQISYTYYNEYDELTVELVETKELTTGKVSGLGPIYLNQTVGELYDNKIEIIDVKPKDTSDDEAVYGLSPADGLVLKVHKNAGGFDLDTKVDRSSIDVFKKYNAVSVTTLPKLSAKTNYDYEFVAKDFFGNDITLIDNTGNVTTSKSSPKATIELKDNEIGNVSFKVSIDDIDNAIIPTTSDKSKTDMYFVILPQAYLNTDRENVENDALLFEKLADSKYTISLDASTGLYNFALTGGNTVFTATDLFLDTSFRAMFFADYNLENGYGDKIFEKIGELDFKSSGLSTLGNIYVSGKALGITEDSARLDLTLNTARTNEELKNIITGLNIYVTPDSTKGYKENEKTIVSGFDKTTRAPEPSTDYIYTLFKNGTTYESVYDHSLKSMTDYYIYAEAICTYKEHDYSVNVILDIGTFKTLRAEPKIEVIDPVFAGGQIVFDCTILDEDGAICGNSGDKVVINLYKVNDSGTGDFVKKIRVDKSTNRDNLKLNTVEFENIDMESAYYIDFVALEYNNGYSNETYKSNHTMYTYNFDAGINYTGTIRLQNLNSTTNASVLNGEFKIVFNDPDDKICELSSGDGDYYVRISRYSTDGLHTLLSCDEYGYEKNKDKDEIDYTCDFPKGDYEAKAELLIKIGDRVLKLDEINFTLENTIKGFSNTYEFIKFIKENPKGKFIATSDIDLVSNKEYYPIDGDSTSGEKMSGNKITTILNADVDFQGYELRHHFNAAGEYIFNNIGPEGKFHNVNYVVDWGSTGTVRDTASLCYSNYGVISDVFVEYKGGNTLGNYDGIALLARQNAATGVIENFVINNNPEPGRCAFAIKQSGAFVTYINHGIVRNGYVYGEDIYSNFYKENDAANAINRNLGTICGVNYTLGQIYSCYSLVGIDLESFAKDWTGLKRYGALVGYSSGYIGNMYYSGDVFGTTTFGPTVGEISGKKYENLYYWNKNNTSYNSTYNKMMSLENMYDTGWQTLVLGDEFIVSNVELGYYPHVILSNNLPEQEYIPLPSRKAGNLVDIAQTEVISYDDTEGAESALVKFRFSNEYNAEITGVEIDSLTVILDKSTEVSADGFTTIYATVKNPKKYKSSYDITKITYDYNKQSKNTTYSENNPILAVDFYRNIYTADDWYNYMVLNANKAANDEENVRLRADISFDGVEQGRVRVTGTFSSKLDGNGHTISDIDFIASKQRNNNNNSLFSNTTMSLDMTGVVKNLTIKDYKAGGTAVTSTYTYSTSRAGVFYTITGEVENVHVVNETLEGYGYMGGIAAYASDGASFKNCTVNNLTVQYTEPTQVETDGAIGGIVGYMSNVRVENCYAKNVDVKATDMRNCVGIGGLIGYGYMSVVENAYATGNLEVRGNKVGGIIGDYNCTSSSYEGTICVKNVISKVDIICYTDVAGGIIGSSNLTTSMISDTNNMSGVAFGNVYGYNPDVNGISQTVGRAMGKQIKFWGSEMQLVNGIYTTNYNSDVCLGLISYEQACNPSTYNDIVGMSNVYNYSPASDGNLPHLYYNGTTTELPFQGTDGFEEVKINRQLALNVDVIDVQVDTASRVARITFSLPEGATIEEYTIEDLEYEEISKTYSNGSGTLIIRYEEALSQNHFLDSYILSDVKVKSQAGIADIPMICRIPVTLYKDVFDVPGWLAIDTEYENYRIVGDLDFAGYSGYLNKKIGRIWGYNSVNSQSGTKATFKNIKVNDTKSNFIGRLNSSISNVIIEDVTMKTGSKNCIGLVGTSYGEISGCDFKNIDIEITSSQSYVGIIGYQVASSIHDCTLTDIHVNDEKRATVNYVGSLAGYIADMGSVSNIKLSNSSVYGKSYLGGLVGSSYAVSYNNITIEDVNVTAKESGALYCGGMVGVMGNSDVCYNSANCNDVTILGKMTNADRTVLNKTVVGSDGLATTKGDTVEKDAVSTMTVSGVGYVGGIAGYAYVGSGTYSATSTGSADSNKVYTNLVSGIRVNGQSERIGGAFGYNVWYENWTEVNDCYVYAKSSSTSSYVGGFSGRSYRRIAYSYVRNVYIETENMNSVGGFAGAFDYGPIYLNVVEDSKIDARVTSGNEGKLSNVGGLVGYTIQNLHVQYDEVINTDIIAPNHVNVGGVVGKHLSVNNSGYIMECGVLGDVDSSKANTTDAAVAESMKIEGYNYVGGIVGYQNSGYVYYNTTNANVVATGPDSAAGGLVGFYQNGYISNSNNTKTGYVTRNYRNIALGSVKAEKYAGGMFGQLGMVKDCNTASGLRVKGVNGASNDESALTYANLMICNSIDATNGNAYPVAGDVENYSTKGLKVWSETLLNNVDAYTKCSYLTTVDLSDTTKDKKAYSSAPAATKLVRDEDLRNLWLYYNLGFISNTSTCQGDYRLFINNVESAKSYGYVKATKDCVPIIRYSNSTTMANDKNLYLLKLQRRFIENAETEWIPMPKNPTLSAPGRDLRLMAMRPSVGTLGDTNPAVYASSVDTINITWPTSMICEEGEGGYYYSVTVDGKEIEKGTITERTMTFSYDYVSDITVTYGDFYEEGSETVYTPYNSVKYEAIDLQKKIDVYKDKYYYIKDSTLISGNVNSQSNLGEGYVNIFGSYALKEDGDIVSLDNMNSIGNVSSSELLENAMPLFKFNVLGYNVETYENYSIMKTGNKIVEKEDQLFVFGQTVYSVDGDLNNDKDAILVYANDGQRYQTVLMKDGRIIDLYADEPILPEEITNSGIVDMTNNIYATVPYVLIEYKDGGFAGYNYLTGEVLFEDNKENIGFFEYVSNTLSSIFSSPVRSNDNYAQNQQIADAMAKGEDVFNLTGISNGILENNYTDGEGNGDGTAVGTMSISSDKDNVGSFAGTGEGESVNSSKDGYEMINGSGELVSEGTDASGKGESLGGGKEANGNGKVSLEEENKEKTGNIGDEISKDKESVDNKKETESKPTPDEKNGATEGINNVTQTTNGNTIVTSPTIGTAEEADITITEETVYMVVFNATTGAYDIVNTVEYITNPNYLSENEKMGVSDLTTVANIMAVADNEKKDADGLLIYLLVSVAAIGLAGGFIFYDRKRKANRQ